MGYEKKAAALLAGCAAPTTEPVQMTFNDVWSVGHDGEHWSGIANGHAGIFSGCEYVVVTFKLPTDALKPPCTPNITTPVSSSFIKARTTSGVCAVAGNDTVRTVRVNCELSNGWPYRSSTTQQPQKCSSHTFNSSDVFERA